MLSLDTRDNNIEVNGYHVLQLARDLSKAVNGTVLILMMEGGTLRLPFKDFRCIGFGEGGRQCLINEKNLHSYIQVGQISKVPINKYKSLFLDYKHESGNSLRCNYGACVRTYAMDFIEVVDFLRLSLDTSHTGYITATTCPTSTNYQHKLFVMAIDMHTWPQVESWITISAPNYLVPCCEHIHNSYAWFPCERKEIPCNFKGQISNVATSNLTQMPFHCFQYEPDAKKNCGRKRLDIFYC